MGIAAIHLQPCGVLEAGCPLSLVNFGQLGGHFSRPLLKKGMEALVSRAERAGEGSLVGVLIGKVQDPHCRGNGSRGIRQGEDPLGGEKWGQASSGFHWENERGG